MEPPTTHYDSHDWRGASVWHGTSVEAAKSIQKDGVSVDLSMGYFGQAFYVADNRDLAKSNYADMEDDGAIVELRLSKTARILDLRRGEDVDRWQATGMGNKIHLPDFAARMRGLGIDGIYDNSVGGLAIYNSKAIEVTAVTPVKTDGTAISLPPETQALENSTCEIGRGRGIS